MLAKTKAQQVVRDLVLWLKGNAKKAELYKADGTKIAETTNLQMDETDGEPNIRFANGYAVGRILANFSLPQTYGNDISLDLAYLVDAEGNKLAKSMYLGILPAGTKDFIVAIEVAVAYIVE